MVREIAPEEQLVAGEQRTGRDGAILLAALTEEAERAVGDGLVSLYGAAGRANRMIRALLLTRRPRHVPSPWPK
jgi:hypothetical protein